MGPQAGGPMDPPSPCIVLKVNMVLQKIGAFLHAQLKGQKFGHTPRQQGLLMQFTSRTAQLCQRDAMLQSSFTRFFTY